LVLFFKKEQDFFLKKEVKTFIRFWSDTGEQHLAVQAGAREDRRRRARKPRETAHGLACRTT
jgi:hypothetical protein